MSPCFSLSFLPNSLGIPFWFGLTVPQQFMAFVCKSSYKSGEDKNCPRRLRVPNFQSL
jgi:hypothetical protein